MINHDVEFLSQSVDVEELTPPHVNAMQFSRLLGYSMPTPYKTVRHMLAVIFIVVILLVLFESTYSDNSVFQKPEVVFETVPVEACYEMQPDGIPTEIPCE